MRRETWTSQVAIALVGCTALVVLSSVADASHRPTPRELSAIKTAAMRDCRKQENSQYPEYRCKWVGNVRVSTVSRRYAWASVSGPNYDNSGILRRPTNHSRRWRMIRVVGGGIQPCSYWYKVAPRQVVRDLKIRGFTEGFGKFDYHLC